MTLGVILTKENIVKGSLWKLAIDINGFESEKSQVLATQAKAGRYFEVIEDCLSQSGDCNEEMIQICLLEDNYICWFELEKLLGHASLIDSWSPYLLNKDQISYRIPKVLSWVENRAENSRKYLWGGTLGPNFDCSGLVQSAFASQDIWLPRDAYQQEIFCERIEASPDNYHGLIAGDLLFFGTSKKCTHVGLHIKDGFFWHSSGTTNGRDGIGIDGIQAFHSDPISCYYKSQFRSARRVVSCYMGWRLLS